MSLPLFDAADTTTTATSPSERPHLSRSDHPATDDDDDGDAPDNNKDLLTVTARVIQPDLPEIPLEQVVWEKPVKQEVQQQQQQQPQKKAKRHSAPAAPKQYWIDVEVHANDLTPVLPRLREEVLRHVPLSRFLRRHLTQPTQWQTPQVLTLHDAVFIVMRILGSGGGGRSTMTTVRHTAALCLPHLLVTLSANSSGTSSSTTTKKTTTNAGTASLLQRHQQHRDSVSHLMILRDDRDVLPEATVSGCVVQWLGVHVGRTQTLATALRTHTYELAERQSGGGAGDDNTNGNSSIGSIRKNVVDDNTNVDPVKWNEISATKDTLLRLAAVGEEQAETVGAVTEGDAVSEGLTLDSTHALTGALRVVQHAAAATERLLTRLEKRLDDLARVAEAAQQARINKRLQALTILSAIFLPLTLMAGVWGMNFSHMPELGRPHAYHAALASMAAVAVSLLLFFYRNGWLAAE